MEYHHDRIQGIEREGLLYIDDEGRERTIDFEACRRNWMVHSGQSESRCIAWRDNRSEPPYIEFFSDPKIRFTFPYKRTWREKWRRRPSELGERYFKATVEALNREGWTTFDLS